MIRFVSLGTNACLTALFWIFPALFLAASDGGSGNSEPNKLPVVDYWYEFSLPALADRNDYSVTVLTQPTRKDCGIIDGSGAFSSESDTNVTIMCRGWRNAPTLIETNDMGSAYDPQIALNPDGNAFTVWVQSDGILNNIWANRYTVGSGWGSAELVETNNAGNAYDPQIALDSNGTAFTVWVQDDGNRYNIRANRYTVGSGWGSAELIETNNMGSAYDPQIALDSDGNALTVWVQSDGTLNHIWANRYTVDSGWGNPELIESNNVGSASDPQIALDSNGSALAVWYQSDGSRYNIWANRYTVGDEKFLRTIS